MADYEKREDKALDEIADVINKLDDTLVKLEIDESEDHRVRGWFEDKKAIFEIKKILHEANKYDKDVDKEYDQFVKEVAKDEKKNK